MRALPQRPQHDPWKLIPTGVMGQALLSFLPTELEIHHWICLHCGYRSEENLSSWGATDAARKHFSDEHITKPMRARSGRTSAYR